MEAENINASNPKVIIFVAMESEREKIVKPALEKAGLLGRKDIWIVTTGVGKVNATLSTSMVLTLAASRGVDNKDFIAINVGVCGGNEKAFKEPCVLIDRVANYDFDTSAVDGDKFRIPGIWLTDVKKDCATCLTQDHFCTTLNELPNDDEAFYVDMELFGVTAACKNLGVKMVAIKSVCDLIGVDKQTELYTANFDDACKLASDKLAGCLSSKDFGVNLNVVDGDKN